MSARFLAITLVALVTALAIACGGKLATEDSDSSSSKSQGGAGNDDSDDRKSDGVKKPSTPPPTAPSTEPSPPSGPRRCEFYGGSSSGSTDGPQSYCSSETYYHCGTQDTVIACKCGRTFDGGRMGSCNCNDTSFDFDCGSGCAPSPEVYAKCNIAP